MPTLAPSSSSRPRSCGLSAAVLQEQCGAWGTRAPSAAERGCAVFATGHPGPAQPGHTARPELVFAEWLPDRRHGPAPCPPRPQLCSTPGFTAVTSIGPPVRDSQGTRAAQQGTGSLRVPMAAPRLPWAHPRPNPREAQPGSGSATSPIPGGMHTGTEACLLRATQHPMERWGQTAFHVHFKPAPLPPTQSQL